MKNELFQALRQGHRLSLEEAQFLYEQADLLELAEAARERKEQKSGSYVYFNVNRHINLTNVCVSDCPFCAFSCKEESPQAFALTIERIRAIVENSLKEAPDLTEIHMVSALHPHHDFNYYIDVVRTVREMAPNVHIKAFTPVEIVHFAKISGKSIEAVLSELKEVGLDSLPGGGAEILNDKLRQEICPEKATTEEWLQVMRTAHRLGIPSNATMLYGHIETIEDRIRHLILLRDLQDETGGFQGYVSFPFHPANTKFDYLKRATAWEDLKMIALARLVLDNFDHIKAFWMMLTQPIAQLALAFGADDLDGTVVEEKIIHAAGAKTAKGTTRQDVVKLIAQTGYIPVERDTFYRHVKEFDVQSLQEVKV